MNHDTRQDFIKKIFWVNPFQLKFFSAPPNWWWYARIEKRIKNQIVKNFLEKLAMGKLFYGGNWDLSATLFKESDWIKNIKSLKLNYKNYKNSEWYKLIQSKIVKNGHYKYKQNVIKSEKDLEFLFENYFKEMIESLKVKGFIINENYSRDIPKALIGRNGDLIKTGNGCHRLAIIQEFDIKCSYPIQIVGIHKKLEINGVKAYLINQQEINKYISKKYKVNSNY